MPAAATQRRDAEPEDHADDSIHHCCARNAMSSAALRVRAGTLSAPPFAVDRLRGQEQPERDEAHVVDEVRRVDDAFAEVVEVVDDRQVLRRACRPSAPRSCRSR